LVFGNLSTGYWLGGAAAAGLHWVELGRTTLGATADDITVSSFTAKPYLMVLVHNISSASATGQTRFNSDTGNNYAHRRNNDGGTDSTSTSTSAIRSDYGASSSTTSFSVMNINNIATEEKLVQGQSVAQNTAGAGNAPHRSEYVGKWANTSNQITTVTQNNLSAGDFASGAEVVVLGYDPDDTEGTSFWQELGSNTGDGTSTDMSSGTISAKKYLYVQVYQTGRSGDVYLRFNSDSGSNYCRRFSANGGAEDTSTSSSSISNMAGIGTTPSFSEFFIINKSDEEKLVMGNENSRGSSGAGTAPTRYEWVGKWANTSAQITNVNIISQTDNFPSGSFMKVWGAD